MRYSDECWAVITARAGSKRIIGKNLKQINGFPLIYWTLKAAKESKNLDKIIVNTDCPNIREYSQNQGVQVFSRPEELATDTSTSVEVMEHFLDQQEVLPKHFCLLQPTSPLRQAFHIDEAVNQLLSSKVNGVISLCEAEHTPLWMNTLPENNGLDGFIREELVGVRSQDLEKYYRFNGALFVLSTEAFLKYKNFVPPNSQAYVMEKKYSIDIDDEYDFFMAQQLLQSLS